MIFGAAPGSARDVAPRCGASLPPCHNGSWRRTGTGLRIAATSADQQFGALAHPAAGRPQQENRSQGLAGEAASYRPSRSKIALPRLERRWKLRVSWRWEPKGWGVQAGARQQGSPSVGPKRIDRCHRRGASPWQNNPRRVFD